MKRYPLLFALSLLFLMACSEQPSGPANGEDALGKAAPMDQSDTDIDLRDRYIVVFKKSVGNVDVLVDQMTRGNGSTVHYRYRHAIKGFCATIPPQALEGLGRNPNVDYIEADGPVFASSPQVLPSGGSLWGLDRIDQPNLPLDYRYHYPNTASEVTAYIIDTGIRYDHVEFGGRAVFGYDAFGSNGADQNGHGTHVAGTVGGEIVGVAKAVNLVSVRVLDRRGSGTISGVIAGVDWVTSDHTNGPAVANMSLGGGLSTTLNTAVSNSIADGVTYVVAAGNDNNNACNYSPASVGAAITVGSTTSSDARSSFSNYGSCLDLFAPGSSIYSAYKNSSSSYATLSGTSMAAPHVAGVVALYLEANPTETTTQVANAITSNATTGKVTSAGTNSPDKLLYSGFITGGGNTTPAPNAPLNVTASYSSSTGDITVGWTDNSSDETGFEIEYSVGGGAYQTLASLGANAISYTHANVTTGTTYTYRVRSVKTGAASSSWATSNTVSVPSGSSTTVYVTATSGASYWANPSNWIGEMTVTVSDGNAVVAGATVSVSWSGGASGSSTGVTDVNGVAVITTNPLNGKKVGSVTMSVTNVTGSNLTYGGYANGAGDVLVSKP